MFFFLVFYISITFNFRLSASFLFSARFFGNRTTNLFVMRSMWNHWPIFFLPINFVLYSERMALACTHAWKNRNKCPWLQRTKCVYSGNQNRKKGAVLKQINKFINFFPFNFECLCNKTNKRFRVIKRTNNPYFYLFDCSNLDLNIELNRKKIFVRQPILIFLLFSKRCSSILIL